MIKVFTTIKCKHGWVNYNEIKGCCKIFIILMILIIQKAAFLGKIKNTANIYTKISHLAKTT